MKAKLFIITIICLFPRIGFCWNALTHEIIFAIAYEKLTPAQQQKIAHYVHDYEDGLSREDNFYSLAAYADRTKQYNPHARRLHYYDAPWSNEKINLPVIPEPNLQQGLADYRQILMNQHSSFSKKAIALRWYIHLFADAHQPLHVSTRVSMQNPRGDVGGLRYKLHYRQAHNLHQLWDEGFYFCKASHLQREKRVESCAHYLETKYPPPIFAKKDLNYTVSDILQEGLSLTKEGVYPIRLSNQYLTWGKAKAEQRVALAGYRLANELRKIL